MKTSCLVLLAFAFSVVPAAAHAQVLGSCTGSITGRVSLAAPGADGQLHTITQGADKLIGEAACLCGSSGLSIDIALESGLPAGTATAVTAWVGEGCADYATRSNTSNATCRQIAGPELTNTIFDTGSGFVGDGAPHIEIPLDVASLVSPEAPDCTVSAAALTRSIYVFVGSDQTNPDGICEADLTASLAQPLAPSVTVATTEPTSFIGSGPWLNIQWLGGTLDVLCAPTIGPLPTAGVGSPEYSTCLPGGVLDTKYLALDPADQGPASTPANAVGATTVALPSPLDHLDPRYRIPLDPYTYASSGSPGTPLTTSLTLDHLGEGTFDCTVLAIDDYGNATPSAVVTVTKTTPAVDCPDAGTT